MIILKIKLPFLIDLPYRQQGNGQIIYQQLENYCRQQGVQTLRLGVLVDNLAGRKMWEKHGFVKIADKTINGKHHLVCEKKLA
ncbi:GNAT family N-acetyltransferase [Enterococcus durans]|uniref:GNAT family N-acetyltransferase n=1 Tax=Enterococcus durans TaxID=53345 RepID=UPI000DEA27BC|nr:GNAT family N-acetyltransferase [Enterococcus durans]MCG3448913.1 GNAT family N-acetyltransferase [Enterococcus durans]